MKNTLLAEEIWMLTDLWRKQLVMAVECCRDDIFLLANKAVIIALVVLNIKLMGFFQWIWIFADIKLFGKQALGYLHSLPCKKMFKDALMIFKHKWKHLWCGCSLKTISVAIFKWNTLKSQVFIVPTTKFPTKLHILYYAPISKSNFWIWSLFFN